MSASTAMPDVAATNVAAIIPPPAGSKPASADDTEWLMPLSTYERIVEAGLLSEFRQVYLWDGRLCERLPINRPHSLGVKNTYDKLRDLRLEGYEPETETPMAIRKAESAPQPDVKIVRGRSKDYNPRVPTSADVALVVEVAESSVSKDRVLASTYAREEIAVYWVLNLISKRLEVYSKPVDGVYTSGLIFGPDEEVSVILDGSDVGRIRVGDLLPN